MARPLTTTVGYHPSIDSYEIWHGSSWSARKEVLAWGAIGRLRVRTTRDGVVSWVSSKGNQEHRQAMDILDVRLLLPDQHDNLGGESIVTRRANGEVVKYESASEPKSITQVSRYLIDSVVPNCIDVSKSANPLLAVCDPESIQLFPVRGSDEFVKPSDTVHVSTQNTSTIPTPQRKRAAKFLSDTTLAVASQYLQGREQGPISIYDIGPTGISRSPLMETKEAYHELPGIYARQNANVIAPLLDNTASTSSRPGKLFLSGWTDGVTRLHDLRLPGKVVAAYTDVVDNGQIMSLLPVGLERFVAGGSDHGCLKTFDLRMPGARAYSYLSAQIPQRTRGTGTENIASKKASYKSPSSHHQTHLQRDINIFLTPLIKWRERPWEALSQPQQRSSEMYQGSVYSLSSPSPCSSTIYAGIANHVLQLDFLSTDDISRGAVSVPTVSSNSKGIEDLVFDFSCYERPRRGRESTDPVLLRKQMPLALALEGDRAGRDGGGRIRSPQKGHEGTDPSLLGKQMPLASEVGSRVLSMGRHGHLALDADHATRQTEDGWDARWFLDVFNPMKSRASAGFELEEV